MGSFGGASSVDREPGEVPPETIALLRSPAESAPQDDPSGAVRIGPNAALGIALTLQAVLLALIIVFLGPLGWDDGAITLAYSHTFAETGRIALTPISEQVEGFSSVSWFLLNALFSLFHPGFEGAILLAQLAAGLCLGLATFFVWLIARAQGLRSGTILAILLVLSMFGPSIAEIGNGMEMTLFAASGLALLYALYVSESRTIALLASSIFLTTRFEAMVYFAGMLAPLLLRRRWSRFLLLCTFGAAIVGLQEVARYALLGEIMPNTIFAKMHVPYSSAGSAILLSRGLATIEAFLPLLPFILVACALAMLDRKRFFPPLLSSAHWRYQAASLAAPVLSVIAFSALAGKNWGYGGRMQFLALPLLLLLMGMVADRSAAGKNGAARGLLLAALVTIPFSWVLSAPDQLSAMFSRIEQRALGRQPTEQFGVTPATFRLTGMAVDALRDRLGLDGIVFMTPDVGGLGLCCSKIRVIDIAMLANRRLAHEGYGALAAVMGDERPDVIEVQTVWADSSGIYGLPAFLDQYEPVIVDRTRFYLRRDHVQRLLDLRVAEWCRLEDPQCLTLALSSHRYAGHLSGQDDIAFLRQGRFLLIEDSRKGPGA